MSLTITGTYPCQFSACTKPAARFFNVAPDVVARVCQAHATDDSSLRCSVIDCERARAATVYPLDSRRRRYGTRFALCTLHAQQCEARPGRYLELLWNPSRRPDDAA